jgi:hypothetical protein
MTILIFGTPSAENENACKILASLPFPVILNVVKDLNFNVFLKKQEILRLHSE